jgi:ABC-type transporter Mla MlaB component
MSLQITNNSGIFEINGELNSQNVVSLHNHFKSLLNFSKIISISLHKLNTIDRTAVIALKNLYEMALAKNKVFYIVGQENEKVKQQFQLEKLNYILHSSF